MEKVLFDLTQTQPGQYKRHGGGIFGEVVFNRIIEKNLPVACVFDSARWLNPTIEQIIKDAGIEVFDIRNKDVRSVITQRGFKVYYSPLPVSENYSDLGCKVKCTVHGPRALELGYDSMMAKYRTTSWKVLLKFLIKRYVPSVGYKHAYSFYQEVLSFADYEFSMVSNHSKYSLLSYLPQFINWDIPVFYSPSTNWFSITDRVYNENYFLLVSADRWEKNNLRAIIALDRLFSNGLLSGKKVKVTGASSSDVFKYKIKNKHNFEFLGYVEDRELNQLYHDAYCLIYPSLNEGFGYPPLEAMYYGTPVIASPFTSITEVLEGSALYTNPLSIEEIMSRVLRMCEAKVHKYYSDLAVLQASKIRKRQVNDLEHLIDFIYGNQGPLNE